MDPRVSEIFNKRRMDRCLDVALRIIDNWRKTNSYSYRVVSREPIEGKTLDELKKLYFAVGVAGHLTDIPFLDMLIVFDFIAKETAARLEHRGETEFKTSVQLKTEFSEGEAFALLKQITIQVAELPKPGD